MFLLLLSASVSAAPVSGDVQVRLFPSAVEFAEEFAESMDTSLAYDLLSYGEYDCYETLEISNFNLEIPIDDVEITYGQDAMTLQVSFGQIHGEDIGLYGESGWWDTCLDFDKTVEYINLDKASFTLPLQAERDKDGRLSFTWSEAPTFTGDLDTDIAWFPDTVVLYFVEDLLFQYVGDYIAEAVPPMLEDYLGQSLLDGDYDGLLVDMAFGQLELTDEVLALSIDSYLGFEGEPACEVGDLTEAPGGGQPELAFDAAGDAHMAVGLTEEFINRFFYVAWGAGLFCSEPESFTELKEDLSVYAGVSAATMEAISSLDEPPVMTLTNSGMRMDITGQRLELTAPIDGIDETLLSVVMDIEAGASFGFDHELTALSLSFYDVSVDYRALDVSNLTDSELAQSVVEALVERWLAKWIEAEVQDITLFSSLYYAYDVAMQMSSVGYQDGGLEIYFDLYSPDDPEVDRTAPETEAELVSTGDQKATFSFEGTDDREGALVYAWQVDGGGWSDWTLDTSATAEDLFPGDHTVEVKARDAWLNEDATPAQILVSLSGDEQDPEPEPGEGCMGCAASPAVGGAWWVLLALVGIRRRR